VPLLPLLLVVIFAGLLLGGLLAKFFGQPKIAAQASPMPLVTPVSTPGRRSTPAAPSPSPSPEHSAAPSAMPSSSPRPSPNPTHVPSPSPKPAATEAVVVITPPPRASAASEEPAPAATPAAESSLAAEPTPASPASPGTLGSDRASSVVRSYLEAVARGDQSTAAGYLTSGLPNESYMTPSAKIASISSDKNADGTYKVTADVITPKGEYFETFRVENGPYGYQISDHYTIKVQ
jgi:hypothetical protein